MFMFSVCVEKMVRNTQCVSQPTNWTISKNNFIHIILRIMKEVSLFVTLCNHRKYTIVCLVPSSENVHVSVCIEKVKANVCVATGAETCEQVPCNVHKGDCLWCKALVKWKYCLEKKCGQIILKCSPDISLQSTHLPKKFSTLDLVISNGPS